MAFRLGGGRRSMGGRGGSLKLRLIIGVIVALVAVGGYFFGTSENPFTGKDQHVNITPTEELRFGLAAMPELTQQFGGESGNQEGRATVDRVGRALLDAAYALYEVDPGSLGYEFSFTLLDDDEIVNAFALPGGPTFITDALYNQIESEGQLAGVMGHEIGHVIHRHGAERMAKQKLTQGLTSAAVMASGDYTAGQMAQMVGNFVQMSYGRDDELQCDREGLVLMSKAGYDPRSMIGVMEILNRASGGKGGTPEWASTHPNPENRIDKIKATIDELFPDGVPDDLRE